jgi:ABC-type amino acid transport substrate-binding protein
VDGKLPGFSFVNPDGSYSGLDVDICKATAAAVLVDPSQVDFRDLNSTERFAALASGEIDLLSRNTTATLSRDAPGGNALSFAPTVFYDGQGIMTPKASGITSLKALAGQTICVESGTTTELNLADRMREIKAPYTPLRFQTGDQTYAAYLQGRCVAVTSDRSQLAGKRTSFAQRPLEVGVRRCPGSAAQWRRSRRQGGARVWHRSAICLKSRCRQRSSPPGDRRRLWRGGSPGGRPTPSACRHDGRRRVLRRRR